MSYLQVLFCHIRGSQYSSRTSGKKKVIEFDLITERQQLTFTITMTMWWLIKNWGENVVLVAKNIVKIF